MQKQNDNFINIKNTKLKKVDGSESKNGQPYMQYMFTLEREGAENLMKKLSEALNEEQSEGALMGIRLSKKVSKQGNPFLSSFGFVFAKKPMEQKQAPKAPASDFNFDAL